MSFLSACMLLPLVSLDVRQLLVFPGWDGMALSWDNASGNQDCMCLSMQAHVSGCLLTGPSVRYEQESLVSFGN